MNKIITYRILIPLDLDIMLGPYKFNLCFSSIK